MHQSPYGFLGVEGMADSGWTLAEYAFDLVREDPGVGVSQLRRNVSDRESNVLEIEISSEDVRADNKTLGGIQSRASEAPVQTADRYTRSRCNRLGAGILVWLSKRVDENLSQRRRQARKPRLKSVDDNRQFSDRAYAHQNFTQMAGSIVCANDDQILQAIVGHVRDAARERRVEGNVADERDRAEPANEFARARDVHRSVCCGAEYRNAQWLEAHERFKSVPRIREAEFVVDLQRCREVRSLRTWEKRRDSHASRGCTTVCVRADAV